MTSLCVGGRQSDDWDGADEDKAAEDAQKFFDVSVHIKGWDLAQWSERCASIPKITGSNLSGGSELTFHSALLLTARGDST
jgi:hypothetical protein